MLEYSKTILSKVSFDESLFIRELRKAFQWLEPEERRLLKAWCISRFGDRHKQTLTEVFENQPF